MSVAVTDLLDRLVGRTIRDITVPAELSRDALLSRDARPIPIEVWLEDGAVLWITAWHESGETEPHHPFRGHDPICPTTAAHCRYGEGGSCARCPYRRAVA